MAREIRFFGPRGDWFELSNFYPSAFEEGGLRWPTVEHYFQAQKFPGEASAPHRERIRTAGSPRQAKALGQSRKVAIRPDWERVKESIMLHALRRKFSDPRLKAILLSAKDRTLVEDSPYDAYWGRGRTGRGKNRLGVLLMRLREELRRRG